MSSAASATVSADERPNIIVFVTDDQVKQELGCYNGPVLTPHIDRLAREGMRFDKRPCDSRLSARLAMILNLNEHDFQIMDQDMMTEPRTNRGIAIKLLTLIVIGTTTMLDVAHSAPVAPRDRPNIIFFINDDQVKEEVGCYGGKVLTPQLDRLAREGMRMDNAHVVSTVCKPSRYSLFTGRFPGNSYSEQYRASP